MEVREQCRECGGEFVGARVLRIMEDVGFGSLLHNERSHKGWKYMLESSVHWRVASGWGRGGKNSFN